MGPSCDIEFRVIQNHAIKGFHCTSQAKNPKVKCFATVCVLPRHAQWPHALSCRQLNSSPCWIRTEFLPFTSRARRQRFKLENITCKGFGYIWHLAVVPVFTQYDRYRSGLVDLVGWNFEWCLGVFSGHDGVSLWECCTVVFTFQDVIWQLWLV